MNEFKLLNETMIWKLYALSNQPFIPTSVPLLVRINDVPLTLMCASSINSPTIMDMILIHGVTDFFILVDSPLEYYCKMESSLLESYQKSFLSAREDPIGEWENYLSSANSIFSPDYLESIQNLINIKIVEEVTDEKTVDNEQN